MPMNVGWHRRISPKELKARGWTAQPKGPGAGRDYHHQDGWQITHCGHPTAHWPYLLTDPDGQCILTGAAFGNPPSYGTAWPTVAAAVDFVAGKREAR